MRRSFLFLFCLTTLIALAEETPYSLAPGMDGHVLIHNRILAKVHGKTISVMDLVKKMDVFLSENYPQIATSPPARFQFYTTQWKKILSEMVDAELMIADAEKIELKVTDAEVRERLYERFGPNVMKNLDKLSMTYDEARKMVWTDMVAQRMTWHRINSKALQRINPIDVREAYQGFVSKNPPGEEWKYEVLSIRGKDKELSSKAASSAANLIAQTQAGLKGAADKIKDLAQNPSDLVISVSEVLTASDREISLAHKAALTTLKPGEYSQPISQINRFNNEVVDRIFHLIDHTKKDTPAFTSMAEQLREELLQKEAGAIREEYSKKIRRHFGYDEKHMVEAIPENFEPFTFIE